MFCVLARAIRSLSRLTFLASFVIVSVFSSHNGLELSPSPFVVSLTHHFSPRSVPSRRVLSRFAPSRPVPLRSAPRTARAELRQVRVRVARALADRAHGVGAVGAAGRRLAGSPPAGRGRRVSDLAPGECCVWGGVGVWGECCVCVCLRVGAGQPARWVQLGGTWVACLIGTHALRSRPLHSWLSPRRCSGGASNGICLHR